MCVWASVTQVYPVTRGGTLAGMATYMFKIISSDDLQEQEAI